ncbi:MAG: LPS assembly lipoprotein LptE [Caulobacter sp.]|jgi:LPS-assembly lipoprotein
MLKRTPPALALAAVLTLGAVGLAGCGFTPLYAAPGVAGGLGAIETIAPEGRAGALLRESMDDALGRDLSVAPQYRLEVELDESRIPRGRRPDGVASRFEYVVVANWKLVSRVNGATVAQGTSRAQITFDRADQPYASIAAQQDAEQKAADELARKIRLDLANVLLRQNG